MIEAVAYDGDGVERYGSDDLQAARAAEGTTWVRVADADEAELDRVADAFGIHPLSVEDVRRDVRPKTEEFPDHTFLLVKTATLRRGETTFEEEIRSKSVGLFLGRDWLVTLSTERVDAVTRTWEAVTTADPRVVGQGADFAAYRVVDAVVDDYYGLLDEIEDLIESIEDGVLEGPDTDVLTDLNAVRRDLLSFRKLVWPTRDAVGVLARGDPDVVAERTEKYYRDVYDHLVQLVDLTETYRELARGARDIYLNALSQSTNEVMKALTVVATVFIPLTFVAGVYGMNFADGAFNMPELGWPYAYPAVVLGMGLTAFVLLVYFRQEGWL
ncbi:MAG: magnesium/cobalt transporter CorA [Haloferacaceae archaeon]